MECQLCGFLAPNERTQGHPCLFVAWAEGCSWDFDPNPLRAYCSWECMRSDGYPGLRFFENYRNIDYLDGTSGFVSPDVLKQRDIIRREREEKIFGPLTVIIK